ncbi:hypothetical protein [Marinimicrobium agarilyticum]|uniref:hypothetical protein n=1 Tax=Marinimicrobium agarilyticum TaxID=306546 RepID=UPI0003F68F5D|nr:hypothetical protein [Marinimicrobium agarilyticum]
MEKLKRISSKSGTRFIEIMKTDNGSLLLQKFVQQYDPEEDRIYEIREFPDPEGRYGDLDAAIAEAMRLLK